MKISDNETSDHWRDVGLETLPEVTFRSAMSAPYAWWMLVSGDGSQENAPDHHDLLSTCLEAARLYLGDDLSPEDLAQETLVLVGCAEKPMQKDSPAAESAKKKIEKAASEALEDILDSCDQGWVRASSSNPGDAARAAAAAAVRLVRFTELDPACVVRTTVATVLGLVGLSGSPSEDELLEAIKGHGFTTYNPEGWGRIVPADRVRGTSK